MDRRVEEPVVPTSRVMLLSDVQVSSGLILSLIFTVALQVEVFEDESVTVKVTVDVPMSAQEKLDFEIEVVNEQLSVLPLFTSAKVIEAVPVDPTSTVVAFEEQIGLRISIIFIIVVQVEVFE